MDSLTDRRQASKARDEFLSSGTVPRGLVREPILSSWQRSRQAGVDADLAHVPFQEVDPAVPLARSAQPVLARLEEQLADLPVSLVLTDADGRLLERRESHKLLRRRLDGVVFAQGYSYAEANVGTNGVGTALAEGRPVYVDGPEHFNELIQAFSCAGAPIRNPFTHRIDGLVDLSCLCEQANPIMRALVQQAAQDIERALYERGSLDERALLEEFLSACRNGKSAVLAVGDDVVMADSRATSLLGVADQAILKAKAQELEGRAQDATIELSLPNGRWARVRCTPVSVAGRVAGTVMKINVRSSAERPDTGPRLPTVTLPGTVGTSPAWRAACADARAAARRGIPLLLLGEAGTGKLTLARGAHQDHRPGASLHLIDCAQPADQLASALEAALDQAGATVVLRHLELLAAAASDDVAGCLDRLANRSPQSWLVGTARAPAAGEQPGLLLRHFAASVTVPALRHRPEDIRALVPLLLDRLAPRRTVACTPEALRTLAGYPWPGNAEQLRAALSSALYKRPAGDLRPEDLPAELFSSSHRPLSALEALERDAITDALQKAGGNKAQAASALGLSRSSLYRKIHSYGIEGASPTA